MLPLLPAKNKLYTRVYTRTRVREKNSGNTGNSGNTYDYTYMIYSIKYKYQSFFFILPPEMFRSAVTGFGFETGNTPKTGNRRFYEAIPR